MNINCLLPLKLPLLESPVWDEKLQCLWFVNIFNEPKVYCYHIITKELKEFNMPEIIGCLALTTSPNNKILVALSSRIALLDVTDTPTSNASASSSPLFSGSSTSTSSNQQQPLQNEYSLETISDMTHDSTKMRLNDGRVDKLGRLWVGSMCADGNDDPNNKDGELFCIATTNNITPATTTNPNINNANSDGNNIANTSSNVESSMDISSNITSSSTNKHTNIKAIQQVMRNQFGIPNATAFSPDGRTMYWSDSVARKILSFTLDYVDFKSIIDTADIGSDLKSKNITTSSNTDTVSSNEIDSTTTSILKGGKHDSIVLNETAMVFVDFAHDSTLSQEEVPDGATCDAEGYLWLAHFNGSCISRFNPNGTLDRRIQVPCKQPTCIAFGGENLDILYVTSARLLPPESLTEIDGCLLAITGLGVKGLPESRFII